MGMSHRTNPTGPKSHGLQSESQTGISNQISPAPRRKLTAGGNVPPTFPVNQPYTPIQKPAIDLPVIIAGLTLDKAPVTVELLRDKALVAIEGQSGTTWYEAKNLSPRKAGKLVAELIEGVASVAIGDGQGGTTCYVAHNLAAEKAAKLVRGIGQGRIDLEEVRKQELGDVEGGVARIIESVGKVATEAASSIAFGTVGEVMVTLVGPPGAMLLTGVLASLARDREAISATSAIMSGVILTFTGPPIAMFLTVGTAVVAKLLQEKTSHE